MRTVPTSVLAVALLAGCTIIVERPGGGGGGGGGGGVPALCGPEADDGRPTAHLIFDVRVDRSMVPLTDAYAELMQTTSLGLLAAGVRPTRLVLLRLDERPVGVDPLAAWGCDLGGFELPPEQVLRHYATAAPPKDTPLGCALDPMLAAAGDLSNLVTRYPETLPGVSGRRIFGDAPDLVLWVHIDSLARRSGAEDAACSEAWRLAEVDADGRSPWLRYADGHPDADRVFHWFVATDEGVDRETFADRCRRLEGFPTEVLDVLEPSARPLYTPIAQAIDAERSGHAPLLGLCSLLSPSLRDDFLLDRILGLARSAGATPDPKLVAEALSGGFGAVGVEPTGEGAAGR